MATADEHEPALPPGVALAWGLQPSANRGPKRTLSVPQIIETAIQLADANGLSGLSMSKVAKALGFTTMSLYRYVSSKDDLLALMVDAACGAPPAELFEASDWRTSVDRWARAILLRYREHPWVFHVPVSGPPIMPNQLAWLDAFLRGLATSGLSSTDQLSTSLLVDGYVRSWAQLSAGLYRAVEAEGATTVPPPTIMASLITPERYPALAPMIAAGEFDGGENEGDDLEDIFEYSLARILDGLEVAIERAAAAQRPKRKPSPPIKQR